MNVVGERCKGEVEVVWLCGCEGGRGGEREVEIGGRYL